MLETTTLLAVLAVLLVLHAIWVSSKLTTLVTAELTEEEEKEHRAYWGVGGEPVTYHSYMLETAVSGRDILAIRAWMKLGWKFYPEKLASVLINDVCEDRECQPVSSGNIVSFLNPVYLVVNIGGLVCLDFVLIVASVEIPRFVKMFNGALDQANDELPEGLEYNMTVNVVDGAIMRAHEYEIGTVQDNTEVIWNLMKENDEKYEDAVDAYLAALADNADALREDRQ